jgi:dipeptidyl aminopeptidase/acylaminoacyl peptidase
MKRHAALFALSAVMAGCATTPREAPMDSRIEQGPPLIPREVLFGNPSRAMGQVSPDGRWLGYIAPRDGVLNVFVAPIDNPDDARPVTNDRVRGVRMFAFAYDGEHLLYPQDTGGDENFRLHAVDLESGRERVLTPEGARAGIAAMSPEHPGEIVVTLNDRDPQFFDLVKVEIDSGDTERLIENSQFAGFVVDDDYVPRLAVQQTAEGGSVIHQREQGAWRPWLTVSQADALTTNVLGFTRDGGTLYLIDSRERDTGALMALDVASGQTRILFEDPRADVGDILTDPRTGRVQAASVNYLRNEWNVLDPVIEQDLAYLRTLGDGEINVVSRTLDDTYWIVEQVDAATGVRYYRYDRRARAAQPWFSNRPELAQYTLSPMHPVAIPSRDGLQLVSYLTLPPYSDRAGTGRPDAPQPMVLFVHGGPWARDQYGFNSMHQWMANRGYAVLSVNFRGSTGFGKRFVNAGDMQWGRQMHDDLIDAVQWAVDNGIARADQVAIMGASYGGYATLAGLAFTPDTFACGVDIVGPSNLVTLLESIPPYWGPMRSMFTSRMGDPDTAEGRALLVERSPLTQVANIRKPLLIGQGANDPRVKQAESDQIVSAMDARGIPVTYVLFPDEGHGFARPENRLAFNAVAEAFLGRCLGGRVEPIGDAFDGASIQVPHGAEYLPGLEAALPRR